VDRRLLGVVMLIVAVVAGMAIPSLTGRRITGSAVAVTFPVPPQVGQCLIPQGPPSSVVQSAAQSYVAEIPADSAHFGRCAGIIGGEIVAVWSSWEESGFGAAAPRRNPCYRSTAAFAGLETSGRSTDLPGAPEGGPVRWRPTIGFDPLQVVPGKLERGAGRDWVACLAVPTGHVGYVGTLRDAFTTGTMPTQFGSCWAGADLDQLPVTLRCDEPHPAELLAKGWVLDPVEVSTEVIEQSCSDLAGRIMRTADPTRGGDLKVVADRLNGDLSARPYASLTIACFVTSAGPQELSGTLIGLADRPVPLVG
jgi:hypothetical protein